VADDHRLGSLRLIHRSLAHRSAQPLSIILVSACICGTVVFAAGYQQQSQQAIVDAITRSP